MTAVKTILCSYCTTANPKGSSVCSACGAPIEAVVEPAVLEPVSTSPLPLAALESLDAVELGKKVEEGSRKAFSAYSAFWRALADAAVIAMVAFGTGVIGGVVGQGWVSIILAALFGVVIGFTRKSYLFTFISGPLGFAGGAVLGGVLWVGGLGTAPMLYCTFLGSAAAAVLGSHSFPFRRRGLWDKIRPLLGAGGGAVFGATGMAVGSGLRAAVAALGLL
ncbi:MAG: zinc ribbon domain-containing protein [Anaerolineales bacterium]|nr:zinc ribbon domain-containing protein [Anaerolineales bacterium]